MLGLDPQLIAMRIPALLIAITFHEFAHARMAFHFGDSTAKGQGRMNLNPLSHLDPIGTLMILIAGFGWAKPVPINPNNFSSYRTGLRWVSFAGPLANFILGFVSLFTFYLLVQSGFSVALVYDFIAVLVSLNVMLALFNLMPIPPLDGSKILMSFLPTKYLGYYRMLEQYAMMILLIFLVTGVFGMIIFPLANLVIGFYGRLIFLILGIF